MQTGRKAANCRFACFLALLLHLHHPHWECLLTTTGYELVYIPSPGSACLQFAICVILLLFLTISDCTQFSSYSHCTCEISSSSSFWILTYLFWAFFFFFSILIHFFILYKLVSEFWVFPCFLGDILHLLRSVGTGCWLHWVKTLLSV